MKTSTLVFAILVTLLFAACKNEQEPLVKEYNTRIAYYPKGQEIYKHGEVTGIKRIIADSAVFVYDYTELSENNDTLIIKNDSAWFNRNLLLPVSTKNIQYKDSAIAITKYHYEPASAYGNLYVNDSLGLIFARLGTHAAGEAFIFYNTDDCNSIHDEIAKDSAFHEYEKYN